jgi:hypothetical protein
LRRSIKNSIPALEPPTPWDFEIRHSATQVDQAPYNFAPDQRLKSGLHQGGCLSNARKTPSFFQQLVIDINRAFHMH